MKIKILKEFSTKLTLQVEFIAKDKTSAARKFKKDVLKLISNLAQMPYQHRKSIYFYNDNIRDLVFKGYTIVYRIKPSKKEIEVFGLIKHEKHL
ncbi:MAG: type II toxin-antitoxin system RelE/ParE family toxin [Vicingaceae bacterium]